MKPGYIYPTRNNKCLQLVTHVHLYLWHYYPDYNQWLFNYMLAPHIKFYLVIDELNARRVSFMFNVVKYQPIAYLKICNLTLSGLYLNGLTQGADRVCFKNVVFCLIAREVVKCRSRFIVMKGCSNLQHLDHTKMYEAESVQMSNCEVLREQLRIFGDKLRVLAIKRTMSVDGLVAKWLSFDSPFKNLVELDLSYNQIEFQALVYLLHSGAVFAETLKKLVLERNLIINSLVSVISRLQLPVI